jgi:lipopolysaccharide export system protein LptC
MASIVLVLLAGLSGWLGSTVEKKTAAGSSKTVSHDADLFFEGSVITTMGPDGKPKNKLVSEKVTHYPDDDTTEIIKPNITLYKGEQSPWHVTANRGWVSPDGDNILLRGDVVIDRPDARKGQAMRLVTSEIRIRPKDQYAETDKPVTMTSDSYKTQSVGMRIYLKQGKLQLLGNVKGHYE